MFLRLCVFTCILGAFDRRKNLVLKEYISSVISEITPVKLRKLCVFYTLYFSYRKMIILCIVRFKLTLLRNIIKSKNNFCEIKAERISLKIQSQLLFCIIIMLKSEIVGPIDEMLSLKK